MEVLATKQRHLSPSKDLLTTYISPSRQTVYEISFPKTGEDHGIYSEFVSMGMDDSSDSGYPDFEYDLGHHSLGDPTAASPLQSAFSSRIFLSKRNPDANLPTSFAHSYSSSSPSSLRPFSSGAPVPFSTPGPFRCAGQSRPPIHPSNHRVHFYASPVSAKFNTPIVSYPMPIPLESSMLSYHAPSGDPEFNFTIKPDLIDIPAPVQERDFLSPSFSLFDDEDPWNAIGKLLDLKPTVNLSERPSLAELLSQEHDKSGVGYLSRKPFAGIEIPHVPPADPNDDDEYLQDNRASHLSFGSPLYPTEVTSHPFVNKNSSKPEDLPLAVNERDLLSPATSNVYRSSDEKQDLLQPTSDDNIPQPCLPMIEVHDSKATLPPASTLDETPSLSSPHLSITHALAKNTLNFDLPDSDLQQPIVTPLQLPEESSDAGRFFESPCLFSEPEDESEGDD